MKFLLAGIIVAACTYIGIAVSSKYRKREQLFADTGVFLDGVMNDIAFRRLPLPEILGEAEGKFTGAFSELLATYKRLLDEGAFLSYGTLSEELKSRYLKPDELKLYVQLFDALGRSDADTQRQTLAEFRRSFDRLHSLALEDKRKYGGMYTRLGVLAGLGLAVLAF